MVVGMIDEGRSCVNLAHRLHAVESAISNAKCELVRDQWNVAWATGSARAV